MSTDNSPTAESLARAREVDALCDRFEEALGRGTAGDLADWLPPAGPLRGAALFELVRLELEHRRRAGAAARAEDYLARYPELAADPARAARLLGGDPSAELPTSQRTTLDSSGLEYGWPAARGPGDSAELPRIPGYEILGELGHGGMGLVLRGRDIDLDRDVAVKVLREQHAGRPELARRFLEEAKISGQLQHPGVVPVYALGTLGDRSPYFAMKLVRGQTLARLLDDRKAVGDDRPRFLGIFAQVCQTLAYAHARGVLHRDLKPANVMVGTFGEVQVMDWGLAKVLPQGTEDAGADGPGPTQREGQDAVRRIRRTCPPEAASPDAADACTQEGDVLGTPAYMAPEQARSDLRRVDERADVFGLGAILCKILTGRPPFTGNTAEAHDKARAARLEDAHARLDSCGADPELVTLAQRCLAAEPEQRPRHAGEVAAAVTAYQDAVAERLRRAEVAGAEARARAEEERKTRAEAEARLAAERHARRVTVGLAAALVLGTAGLGVGGLWVQRQQAERLAEQVRRATETERTCQAAVQEAETHAGQARGLHDDPGRWQVALTAALAAGQRAEEALRAGVSTEEQWAQVRAVRARLEQQERDRQFAAELETIRLRKAEIRDGKFHILGAAPQYAAAFAGHGLDVATAEPAELAGRLREHPLRQQLLAALREWAHLSAPAGERQRLEAVLAAAEPTLTDFERQWRAASRARDRAALERLAEAADLAGLPAATLVLLAQDLDALRATAAAARLLRRGQPRHPADFWLNENLGTFLLRAQPPEPAAALRYLTAALAVRPRSPGMHLNLGYALQMQGDQAGAAAAYREALRLDPTYAQAHNNLGNMLQAQKDYAGAVAAYHEALRHDPKHDRAHYNLGNALREQGDLAGAETAFRTAVRIDPEHALAHNNLGNVLLTRGDLAGAEAAIREALRLDPREVRAHNGLGQILFARNDLAGAVAAYREALRLDPKYAPAHNNLGRVLSQQDDLAGAAAALREALRLDPKFVQAHTNLGSVLARQGDLTEAVAAYREALRLDPRSAPAHYNLGIALREQNDLAGAAAAYREALRLNPAYARAHCNLGEVLLTQGQFAAAVEALRRGHELGSRQRGWPFPSAEWLRYGESQLAVEARLPDLLVGKVRPADAAERLACAAACRARQRYAASAYFYAEAFAADPKLAEDPRIRHRLNAACSAARAAGQATNAQLLPDKTVLRLRRQALAWLRADLALYAQRAKQDPAARQDARRALRRWQRDTDLASVRSRDALERLPAEERAAWRQLWEDAAQLVGTAAAQK
jgi:serine/threonine protein kinase/tetratricopeptide (TPR) repeat protein